MKKYLQLAAALGAGLAVAALQGIIESAGAVVPGIIPDPVVSAILIAAIIRGAGFLINVLGPKPEEPPKLEP
jgi:hypothetical protein